MRNNSSQTNVRLLWKSQISRAHWPKTEHASRNSTTARACQTDSNRLRDRVFLLAVSHAGLKISPWRRFLLKLLRARESEYELWRFARSTFTRIPFWGRDFVPFSFLVQIFPRFCCFSSFSSFSSKNVRKTSNTKKGSNTDIEITLYIYQYTYTYTY